MNNTKDKISSVYAREHFELICNYVSYLGYDSKSVFLGLTPPEKIFHKIDVLANKLYL